jgi:uncharacterized membrane protein
LPRTKPKKGSPRQGTKRASAQSKRGAVPIRHGDQAPSPVEDAGEALREWGKAIRYGAAAISPVAKRAELAATDLAQRRRERRKQRQSLIDRLNPSKTEKGGRLGDVADKVLSKMGAPGKVASALSVGSRAIERRRARKEGSGQGDETEPQLSSTEDVAAGNGFGGQLPIPIQESIEIALPVKAAYELCTRFEDYPEFIDRIEDVEEIDDDHVSFIAKVRGLHRRIEIEIEDERPNERIDWRGTGIDHSGVISFHELAPRLTHLELSVELEPEGLMQRLARTVHLTERAIRGDMRRFKAYAEFWEEEESREEDEATPEEEPVAEEGSEPEEEDIEEEDLEDEELDEDEELEDEEELVGEEDLEEDDEEFVDEEDLDEDEFEDEELEDEEEVDEEPARASRSR